MAIPWTVVEPAETAPSSEGGVNHLVGPAFGKAYVFSDFNEFIFVEHLFTTGPGRIIFDITLQEPVHHKVGIPANRAGKVTISL